MKAEAVKFKKFAGKLLCWLSGIGIATFCMAAAYEIYLFRTSPTSPNGSQTVVWEAHGDRCYVTPMQDSFCNYSKVGGLVTAFTCGIAGLWLSGAKLNLVSSRDGQV